MNCTIISLNSICFCQNIFIKSKKLIETDVERPLIQYSHIGKHIPFCSNYMHSPIRGSLNLKTDLQLSYIGHGTERDPVHNRITTYSNSAHASI